MSKERTVREFVEDLVSDGRPAEHIILVARLTRWNTHLEEVKDEIRSFKKFLKKVFHFC